LSSKDSGNPTAQTSPITVRKTGLAGPSAWDADETISRAIEIWDGHIVNRSIVSFQNRSFEYPHLHSTPSVTTSKR